MNAHNHLQHRRTLYPLHLEPTMHQGRIVSYHHRRRLHLDNTSVLNNHGVSLNQTLLSILISTRMTCLVVREHGPQQKFVRESALHPQLDHPQRRPDANLHARTITIEPSILYRLHLPPQMPRPRHSRVIPLLVRQVRVIEANRYDIEDAAVLLR